MQHGAQQLALWIARMGVTQTAAAGNLGIHKTTLSKILKRKRLPGRQIATNIRDLTGIPLDAWMPTPVGTLTKRAPRVGKTRNVDRLETHNAAG
jgi:transcriptional regulator with XRE-family HTH domain